jgi:hypothetical protein
MWEHVKGLYLKPRALQMVSDIKCRKCRYKSTEINFTTTVEIVHSGFLHKSYSLV